ncbi:MAG: hypothetical protein AB7V58_07545 [Solirubrobacterales bacterium]
MAASRGRNAPVLLLGVALVAATVVLVVAQWDVTFFQDTWAFLLDRQEWSAHSFFDPHNEHIVVIPVLITKVLLEVFGMTSNTPEQIVMGITVLVAPVLLFVWMRRRVGAWLALIAAVLFLFLGSAWPVIIWPFENEFTLPVVFGLAMLVFLDREDAKGDAWACAMLTLATISGSLGLAFIVAGFFDVVLKHRERGWRRAFVFALPLFVYLVWFAGYGHDAEKHLTLHNILASPQYVVEGFASAIGSLLGLSTVKAGETGHNDWGRPLLIGALALVGFAQWRRPGIPRGFWTVAAAGVVYWLLAALNFVPGREASSARYVYAGALFVLLMAAELARGWRFNRNALLAIGAVALLAIGPNLAQLKEGSDYEKEQSVLARGDIAALEIARDTVAPNYTLYPPEIAGTPSLFLIEAEKWFEAVDRWGTPGYSVSELESASPTAQHYADLVLSQALPIGHETVPGFAAKAPAGKECATLRPGEAAAKQVPLAVGANAIEVAPGGPVTISLRRFAEGEFPVQIVAAPGGSTTMLTIPGDRAKKQWFVHVEAAQLVRVCR